MFIVALASLVAGYAILYYAIDAMSHYDSATKTTKGIPLATAFGIPGGNAANTAMVFATWGQAAQGSVSGTGLSSQRPSPGNNGGTVFV